LLNPEERHSYKIDYTGLSKVARNGRIYLILLVGAGRFERPTPCAQGGVRYIQKAPCFQLLMFQADTGILLKPVEPC
jgi:hypothetical protein